MGELTLCPFCGSEDLVIDIDTVKNKDLVAVDCMQCGSRGPAAAHNHEARRLWNRRDRREIVGDDERNVILNPFDWQIIGQYGARMGYPFDAALCTILRQWWRQDKLERGER